MIFAIIAVFCLVFALSIMLPPLLNDMSTNWHLKKANRIPLNLSYKDLTYEDGMVRLAKELADATNKAIPVRFTVRSFVFDGDCGNKMTIRIRTIKFPWKVVVRAENNYLLNGLVPGRLYVFDNRVQQVALNRIVCKYENETGFTILHRQCAVDRSSWRIHYDSLPDYPPIDN